MLPIQKSFINYNYSTRNSKIEYIVIHDVGEVSTARNNRDYFSGGNRGASADFFVDSTNIIQLIDYIKNYSWAVGDGKNQYGISNSNSISIEMCLEPSLRPSSATMTNTINLVQTLMRELNIPLERVVRHYDASRKICPQSMSANNWQLWSEFKKQLLPQVVERKPSYQERYVREFQKFYNEVTKTTTPLVVDGIYGKNTQSAFDLMQKLIKGEY